MKYLEIKSQKHYEENIKFDGIFIIKNLNIVLRENSHAELWGNSYAELWGNSHAELWGNSHAELRENSYAVLRGNSYAELWENSHAVLRGNSHAVLRENSHAELWGNSYAELWENSYAELWENSHAELWGNSHAVLRGNSHAKCIDNSSIIFYNENKISLYGNATSKKYINPIYDNNIIDFLCEKNEEKFILYKSVDDDYFDFRTHTIKYEIGKIIECPDFDPDENRECGGGLHLCFTPEKTQNFNRGKILKCLVDKNDIIVYKYNIEKVRCKKVFVLEEIKL